MSSFNKSWPVVALFSGLTLVISMGLGYFVADKTQFASLGLLEAPTTFYVDINNPLAVDDTSHGSADKPWKTIKYAVSAAESGNTILVAPGNYTGSGVSSKIAISKSGSAGSPITLRATAPGVMTNGFLLSRVNYIVIDGFDISTPSNAIWNSEDYGSGVYLINAKNCEIKNNNIHNTIFPGVFVQSGSANNIIFGNKIDHAGTYAGILMGQGTSNITVEKNDIGYVEWNPLSIANFRSSDNDADGIKIEGTGHIIRGNYIHDLRSPGTGTGEGTARPHTDIFQTWHDANNVLIENNIAIIANNDGVVQGAEIENAGSVSNLTFRNNVFSGMFRGLNIWGTSGKKISGLYVYNNTFNGIQDYATEIHFVASGEVKNNIFNNSSQNATCGASLDVEDSTLVLSNNVHYRIGGVTNTTNNKGACSSNPGDFKNLNPTFSNLTGNDFHLSSVSAVKDKGVALSGLTADLEGIARPQGAAYDPGAYELASGVTPSPSDTTAPVTTASLAGGTYTSAQNVTLSANEVATSYYCLGVNCNPTTVYSGPINLAVSQTLGYYSSDTAGNKETVKYQTYTISIPVCQEAWTCGSWTPTTCGVSGIQTRTCIDANSCGTTQSKPITSQNCTYTCTPNWTCSAWQPATCDASGLQTRTCTDSNSCGVNTEKPAISQSCTYVATTTPVATGLLGYYFADRFFTNLKITKIDPRIYFSWGNGLPDPNISSYPFSIRWLGRIQVATTGNYTFYLKTYDTGRLWIDDKLVITKLVSNQKSELNYTKYLSSGSHEIKVEYDVDLPPSGLRLSWKGPNFTKRVIPTRVLIPAVQ